MRVYVATRFGHWRHAAAAHEALIAAGHVPTSQWVTIAADLNGQCDAVPVGDPQRLKNARMDLADLTRSEALLMLVPPDGGTGMWVELGFVLGLNSLAPSPRTVILVGEAPLERTVFCELVDDVVTTVAEAVALLSAEALDDIFADPRIT